MDKRVDLPQAAALVADGDTVVMGGADPEGNAQVDGPVYMDLEFARAAETVVVTAEQVLTTEEVTRTADRTVVPGFLVDAVVEVPFGAYPGECYGLQHRLRAADRRGDRRARIPHRRGALRRRLHEREEATATS